MVGVTLVPIIVASLAAVVVAQISPAQTPPRSGRLWPRLPGYPGFGHSTETALQPEWVIEATTLAPQVTTTITTTTFPSADVELLTVHVGLANRVRQHSGSVAAELANVLGIPASRVEVIPMSWPPGEKLAAPLGITAAVVGTSQGAHAVGSASSLQQQAPQVASVQMLTRDAPLVARLQGGGAHAYAQYIANFLGVPVSAVVVTPPALDGFPGPSPAPAPPQVASTFPASLAFLRLNSVNNSDHNTSLAAPLLAPALASVPAPSPVPAPAPSPELKPINRAWVAPWSVTITWQNALAMVSRLATALNDPSVDIPLGNDAYPFPQTLARVPSLEYPGIHIVPGIEVRLPPPRDTAMMLGPDPGSHHVATEVAPSADEQIKMIRANAVQAIANGMALQAAIGDAKNRFVKAAEARREELFADPGGPDDAPQIRPPEVAGPHGTEGDSFYGPWPPAVPLTIANRVGGWTHAGDVSTNLLAAQVSARRASTSSELRARLRR